MPAVPGPVRVVHLANYGGPYAGSFVPMLRAALAAARGRGWTAEAAFAPWARGKRWLPELEGDGVPVRFLEVGDRRALGQELGRLLDEDARPTVVHTHFSAFDMPVTLAALRRPRVRIFWHEHNAPRTEPPVVARNVFKYALLARRVDGILCVAPDFVRDFRRRGAPPAKTIHFANAIDTTRFPRLEPHERGEARERLGLPRDALVLLHFGWDWHRKGGDLFLETVRLLGGELERPVVGVTVGGGEPARTLARELGVEHAVLVAEPSEDVRSFYAAADVFHTPSRSEGGPFTMAESFTLGIPVVATDLPSQALQAPGAGARRLTGPSPRELADATLSLLARPPEEAERDAAWAREWVIREMDLRPWAERLVRLYEEALR